MMQIVEIALLVASIIVFLLAGFLFLEILAATAASRRQGTSESDPGPVAVVIPAHNEAANLGATLASVRPQMRESDRLIVVADNCTDATAEIAVAAGAACWERQDAVRRGKGYALQFALDKLKASPPETVIFIDADCLIAEGALQKLAGVSQKEQRPVQALYLMKAPEGAAPRLRVAEFAWSFLNHARMTGLDRLFGVSRITGAGIALPWSIASALDVASGEIVEDLALTLTLTEQKKPPLLLVDALVTSEFPNEEDALAKQRARWEHGSQNIAVRRALPCLMKGISSGDARLFAISLDMIIPPLVNFLMLIMAVFAVSLIAWFLGARAPLGFAAGAGFWFGAAVILGWLQVGREALPLSSLRGLAPFLAAKGDIYGAEGRASAKRWTPTRSGGADGNAGE